MTENTTRRGFLTVVTAALASIPIVGGLFVSLRAGLAPAGSDRPERFPLCRLDEVPDDDIKVCAVSFQMRRGPAVENLSQVVFVTRDPGDDNAILAMSGECTHLSCPVQKKTVEKVEGNSTAASAAEAAPLQCPCHGGAFTRTGEVVEGTPPPRPLRRLRIELPDDGAGMIHLLEI